MEVNQAVDTPIISAKIPTPQVNNNELMIYSDKTEFLRWVQFSPEVSKTEKVIVRIGMLKITAVATTLDLHMLIVEFFMVYSQWSKVDSIGTRLGVFC
tara:strand:- start:425 stop:718 length:294 start_codon:yes stop_codon:yes gene_type:complete